jgi:Type I phosphodiesterase / nucleotide pyrophosphatase
LNKRRVPRHLIATLIALLAASACEFDEQDAEVQRRASEPKVVDSCDSLDRQVIRAGRGYVPDLSADVLFLPRGENYVGSAAMPVHTGTNDALARVPLVFFGPGNVRGNVTIPGDATMADVAPTIAEMIGFDGLNRTDGKVLREVIAPGPAPRLIVTIVWDGVGDNVLKEHPRSWRFLKTLKLAGADAPKMEIGSAPSVTPPIHTTLGTGRFPERHGIPGLLMRNPEGEYVDTFAGLSPANVRVPTLADLYDRSEKNRPVTGVLASVNWHLGMIGHGSDYPGGDADPVVLLEPDGDLFTNPALYSLPDVAAPKKLQDAIRATDAVDGARDGKWRGHPLDDPDVRYASPAQVEYEQLLLENLIRNQRFGDDRTTDLLFVNFKSSDDAGHHWGLTSNEMADTVDAQDDALRRLLPFLDREVGERQWAVIVTADHGFRGDPEDTGGWPIGGAELRDDANRDLDTNGNKVALVDRVISPGLYFNRSELGANSLTPKDVAEWVAQYTAGENLKEGDEMRPGWEGREEEPLFDGAVVRDELAATSCP